MYMGPLFQDGRIPETASFDPNQESLFSINNHFPNSGHICDAGKVL